MTCNNAAKLIVGQAQYSGLMTPSGTFVDDLLVHRISDTHYLLCVNASNQDLDFEHIVAHNKSGARVENAGPRYSQLAIQGPRAKDILQRLTPVGLDPIHYYHFTFGKVSGVDCLIARTGYTGEDGFEIYFAPEQSEKLWNDLMHAGGPDGMIPCGLGARNTLRLEAGMCLYGHEIDETTTPWEAGLGWICKPEKGRYLGSDILVQQKTDRRRTETCGIRNARQAHRPRRISRSNRRPGSRASYQRVPCAISEKEYWDGVRPGEIERHRDRHRDQRSRASRLRLASWRCHFYKRPQ